MTKNNNGLKVKAGLLGVVLLGTIIYTVSLYQDKKKTTTALTMERDLVVDDLNSLKSEYDKAILESNATNEELIGARDRIAKYIDSVKTMKADITSLSRYRRQVGVLKEEREHLLRQVDSLTKSNIIIAMQRDSTFVELEKQTVFNDSLVVQYTQLAEPQNELQIFRWPPPEYSAKLVLHSKRNSLKIFEDCSDLGCMDSIISKALTSNKYDYSYYYVSPDDKSIRGFAIATMMEQFNKEDGSYKNGEARTSTIIDYRQLPFREKLKSILFKTEGYFRVIVFVITDLIFPTKGTVTSNEAKSWVRAGGQSIPSSLASWPFTDEYSITALIYEFKVNEPEMKPKLNTTPVLQAVDHLNGAKLKVLTED